jgi:hypothetical protein
VTADLVLVQAWLTAGIELGIRVEAPAQVIIRGEAVECSAFLPDFGSVNGAAVFSLLGSIELPKTADPDPFCSLLNADQYENFDRNHFIDTLNDWGWFGNGDPPDWYSGAIWSE